MRRPKYYFRRFAGLVIGHVPSLRFRARRAVFTYTRTLAASPDEVFPLLCPTRELDWLEGWNRDLVYSESGFAEDNAIFKTRLDFGETWITTRHDPQAYALEGVIFGSKHLVVKLDIHLHDIGDGTCRIDWRQTHTGLDRAGNLSFAIYDQHRFEQDMRRILGNLEHYLKTGEKQRTGRAFWGGDHVQATA